MSEPYFFQHSDFAWGVSSSAFQTEGKAGFDGKGSSIWDTFSSDKRNVKRGENANEATKFVVHYHQDLDLIKWMNFKHFRFSIAWSRIFPSGVGRINRAGVNFYHKLIDGCLKRGIEPWVTLYHWDLPQTLQDKGGWVNRDVINWFSEYISFCMEEFGGKVKHWMILNEPTAFTALGYFMGIHAPGKKGLHNFLPAMHHAALAQAEGGRLIKSINPNVKVGTTFSFSHVESYSLKERDRKAAKRVDALLNRVFLEPLLGMGYPYEELNEFKQVQKYMIDGDEKKMQFKFDFLGVQNYSREVVKYSFWMPIVKAKLVTARKRKVLQTAMGWENYPKALYHVLKRLQAYEKIPPLVVTETGIALEDNLAKEGIVEDKVRIEFYKKSISFAKKAKEEGVDLQGYFAWSLTDNFEWAEGYRPRFGLIYIDYEKQKRVPKNSAFWFRKNLKTL